ncbi:cobalt ABC transporter permease [Herbidospora sp. NEAU-GS84]|uniref:Cobalt ABC transporter permease n=1 Tax=Herbidospora solisilvae TaxID=2696284 RepID=A0A7C9JB72_9ACTN|nr:energy-coupling factor ABC transporter permease [Herbidospora solisilvae]NAS25448.1 cobalt ABC transporter permease [Herbidospora solisilvae]
MHVPDGFFTAPVAIGAGVVSAAAIAVSLRKAKTELDDRTAPMAGLVAAFIFAVQMLNFPVAAGTSGHLLGGALAAILVGPYTAVLCVSVVLAVQGFFFADGGLTALGLNILLIAIVPAAVGWGIFQLVTRVARNRASVIAGSFVAALISVPIAALVFAVLFVVGGTAPIEAGAVFAAMGGVHVLVGIGEGLITAVTVSSVLAVRPDLVYGARFLTKPLVLKTATGERVVEPARPESTPKPVRPFLVGGGIVALLLAGVVSFFASSSPDGLERVAEDEGFIGAATDHSFGGFLLADYGDVGGVPVGVAGIIGVVITLLVGGAILWSVRQKTAA